MSQPILVLAPLKIEATALRRQLDRAGLQNVVIHIIGLRGKRFDPAIVPPGSTVIIAGLGGALDPNLRVGDVVLDATERVAVPSNAVRGRIYTSMAIVASPAAKAKLFARSGAHVVDMEQAVIALALADRDAHIIGLRAISDSANHALDPVLLSLVDELGNPRLGTIMAALAKRPMRLVRMLSLARNSKRALRNLSKATIEIALKQAHL